MSLAIQGYVNDVLLHMVLIHSELISIIGSNFGIKIKKKRVILIAQYIFVGSRAIEYAVINHEKSEITIQINGLNNWQLHP